MRSKAIPLTLLSAALALSACHSGGPKPMESVERGWKQSGLASWYGEKFHGRRTANGEIYDMYGMTAAHKTLPFDTLVEVKNLANGRTVEVRINDRGPFIRGRIIDLTYTAADHIGMIGAGTATVRVRVLGESQVGSRRFVVQVGAFSDRSSARDLKRELEGTYPKVRIQSHAGIHRVLVGSFKKEAKARQAAGRLRAAGYEALVRPEVRRSG